MPTATLSLKDYLDKRKEERDITERLYKQRKAIYERAKMANEQTLLIESSLKEYSDKSKVLEDLAKDIDDALVRIAQSGVIIDTKITESTKALLLLSYEIRDFLRQAEAIVKELEAFSKVDVVTEKPDVLKCIDAVVKLLDAICENGLASLDKTLVLLKTVHTTQLAINGNCGVIARSVELAKQLDKCMLIIKPDKFWDIYPYSCKVDEAKKLNVEPCKDEYDEYLKAGSLMPKDDIMNESNGFPDYQKHIKTVLEKAQIKIEKSRAWLNCANKAKNEAEASFIACKAAYDLAVTTYKC